jgi:hypothetical protein
MLTYGVDAIERDGALVWRSRSGRQDRIIDLETLAVSDDVTGRLEETRLPEAEVSGRIRLSFIEADSNYEVRAAEAAFPEETGATVSQSEVPLVLTQSEGRQVAERWLAEARSARDLVRFALPPSRTDVGAGDVVRFGDGSDLYRIDSVERAEWSRIDAVRIERSAYEPGPEVEIVLPPRLFLPVAPVLPVFLDLPLLTGDEVPHAPRLAVAADPWPGGAAVYAADGENGFTLNTVIDQPSVIGVTETALPGAMPGTWDRGRPLRVRIAGGALASAEPSSVLAGANAAAIGSGENDDWEVFQFATATLVAPETYELSMRLRGQAGTDGIMPAEWPAGSRVVFLGSQVRQIDLPSSLRGIARRYRIGPVARAFDDPTFVEETRAFAGIGLRPYAPVHLRAERGAGGDLRVGWIRRTRIDGDLWDQADVPLGEAFEAYRVRVRKAGEVRREATVPSPEWIYVAALQTADSVFAPFEIEVAQISDRFGPGLFRRISIDV